MGEQFGERVEAGAVLEPVQVVEDQDSRAAPLVEFRRQPRYRRREDARPGGRQRTVDRGVDRLDPVDRRGNVREEDARFVVELVQCQPRDVSLLMGGPVGQQDGLAVPGWGDDQDDRGCGLGREQAGQPPPRDDPGVWLRPDELRFDEGERRPERSRTSLFAAWAPADRLALALYRRRGATSSGGSPPAEPTPSVPGTARLLSRGRSRRSAGAPILLEGQVDVIAGGKRDP